MKFTNKITPIIIGGTFSGAVALSLLLVGLEPQQTKAAVVRLAQGLAPEEVNLRAKQITVRIDGANVGSGSIIGRSNDEYTVLSNWHVMKNQGAFIVQTIDGSEHQVIASSIKQLPGVDLAVLKFNSNQNYQTAELGDAENLSEGQNVYFAGYPGELRREDDRYYRFFTANLVGILPKSSENGYSLVYNGEAFPGMSGGPVFNRDGLMIGIHGEANINAVSGGTSNYAIPINNYQQAIAKLDAQPTAPEPTPEVATKPESTSPKTTNSEQSRGSDNISSVPTFGSEPAAEETEPEQVELDKPPAKPQTEPQPTVTKPQTTAPEQTRVEVESEEIPVNTTTRRIALVSPKTGIDYTQLRNLLRDKKWSEADLHTYKLVEQIIKSAKQENKHVFIELKTIAQYSCPDIRTVDYLWQKYSGDKFGFSPQQQVWQSVNQNGDFSTQTWRRFATEVGWKKGDVINGSGYLLYDELDFEPAEAPAGHLPWWFALPDEEQKVMKSLFTRCNLNPTAQELEAEARENSNTAQNPANNSKNSNNNQLNINKPPKSSNN
jgi:serine protease Do